MTVIVFGIDALDPELVDPDKHPNLTLTAHKAIGTINSKAGEPSTHELWPTIITGLSPEEHGIQLDDGVAWENPLLNFGSTVADFVLPDFLQTRIGGWLLTNTERDAFRKEADYYQKEGISTIFDGYDSKALGIPNYVIDPNEEDREHQLRRQMGDLFQRNEQATGGHTSSDPAEFYELCMEMSMIRVARVRRAIRSRRFELVFGYTSGLDLIGHVSYDLPKLQARAYEELNDFVGEIISDLSQQDELVLISDHGLQDGVHTEEAMVASTSREIVEQIDGVIDVRGSLEHELDQINHLPDQIESEEVGIGDGEQVREHLEDLGYM